jgi:hypothetical protein
MFAGVGLQRKNNVTVSPDSLLKLPGFYSLSQQDKIVQWNKIKHQLVLGCHRQYGFDYNTIEPVTVISVKISDREWLYNRVKDIHWKQNKADIGNPILKKIKEQVSDSEVHKLIEADYQSWSNANILDSDDILPFESLLDGSIDEWAQHRQLKINKEYLTIICNEVATYQ